MVILWMDHAIVIQDGIVQKPILLLLKILQTSNIAILKFNHITYLLVKVKSYLTNTLGVKDEKQWIKYLLKVKNG